MSEITGKWEFSIQFEEGESDNGTISISGEPGSYSGIFDMKSSSVTRKLQDIVYEDGRLTFIVERLYATISVDVAISGNKMVGKMIFGGDSHGRDPRIRDHRGGYRPCSSDQKFK
ncbi:hypothetical protein NC796_12475 [Aliifodinibius sp. S!AR15-10]|uniref:hypothetical protein n=1 Tax=Aliifodinibius sp. S!AR15-10 TaxID=2950437 RepID=UPI002858F72B|nr:hypothetical protein [Aliifodinibius sp. S!AR15-10]MDR8391965.1 hypothetical protein [Aliifodinibius sp. S!AR15-10]